MSRVGRFIRKNPIEAALLTLLVALVLAHLFLHTTPSPLDSAEALDAHLTDGSPTVVEFYSNL
jgi:hypothetical protein